MFFSSFLLFLFEGQVTLDRRLLGIQSLLYCRVALRPVITLVPCDEVCMSLDARSR